MTKFAEVIYETGAKSVVSYDNESELLAAVQEQHRRAMSGEDAGPQSGRPAERVTSVLLYDDHPADFNQGAVVSSDMLNSLASNIGVGGQVSVAELNEQLSRLASPVDYSNTDDRHASLYKMQETGKLDLSSLEGGAA